MLQFFFPCYPTNSKIIYSHMDWILWNLCIVLKRAKNCLPEAIGQGKRWWICTLHGQRSLGIIGQIVEVDGQGHRTHFRTGSTILTVFDLNSN